MTYKEEVRDLFSVSEDYFLAHCISADFALGKGIAAEFAKRFDTKKNLQTMYPDYINKWHQKKYKAGCILDCRVFNLITKERYFQKPTYESISHALELMRLMAKENGITKIAMPMIGCGLDRLSWDKVSEIIKKTFEDEEIEILVCKK